jgi:NSS family neurotransmitter:Na+ symporter
LMMFYTTVAGWMFAYFFKMAFGEFQGLSPDQVSGVFSNMLADPAQMAGWMVGVVVLAMLVCAMGLQKGVERVTKVMMSALFVILIVLCVRSVTLDNAGAGLAFYLTPDFSRMFGDGIWSFGESVYAAMGQSFFTLSLGIGAMAIFGSYLDKERRMFGEALSVGALDTLVAFMAGLVIFPACFSFGVDPGQGPSLVFVTLPNVFQQMWAGPLWGALFFLFMGFAALSTIIAVFENILRISMDNWDWSRKKSVKVWLPLIIVLSIPCLLGFNVWSGAVVPGIGDIQSFEDFLVSNNVLPLGSLLFVLFCTSKHGWGWKSFLAEANAGKGVKFPAWLYGWVRFGIPVLVLIVFVMGYAPLFRTWFGL